MLTEREKELEKLYVIGDFYSGHKAVRQHVQFLLTTIQQLRGEAMYFNDESKGRLAFKKGEGKYDYSHE